MKTVDGYRLTRAGLDDTSPEAHRVLADVWRRMPTWRKAATLARMFATAREHFAIGMRRQIAGLSDADVHRLWLARYCPELPGKVASMARLSLKPDELDTLQTVIAALRAAEIRYAIGGSIASSLLGISRTTADGDLCVEPFAGKEQRFLDQFTDKPDYYVSRTAVDEAVRLRRSFNVINTSTGFKVDLFVQTRRPFDACLLDRSRPDRLREDSVESVQVVSPEDCVLLKLEWYRKGSGLSDRQWQDILGVLRVKGQEIDLAYLRHWANELNVADLLEEALCDADLVS